MKNGDRRVNKRVAKPHRKSGGKIFFVICGPIEVGKLGKRRKISAPN